MISKNAGFSLIEILISLLILSFGMLGAIKMQLLSIQAAHQSTLYSTAMELASDMAERMRNPQHQQSLAEWLEQVDAALPHARAVICQDSAPWNNATHTLSWDCTANDNASIIIKLGWAEQHEVEANPAPRLAIAVTPYLN
jgi:type IV pilus assembly protein PilV